MNYKSLANGYPQLTAEERFRLLMAALGRGDDVEHAQLCRAGRRITLSMDDHAPYAIAFNKAALIQFIQLLDHAARFEQAVNLASRELLSDRHEESTREVEAQGAGPEDSERRSVLVRRCRRLHSRDASGRVAAVLRRDRRAAIAFVESAARLRPRDGASGDGGAGGLQCGGVPGVAQHGEAGR